MELALVLERKANQPLYVTLSDAIRKAITDGKLQPGQSLPSVRQMAASYHISTATVVRCYEELASQGVLITEPKAGTFVSPEIVAHTAEKARKLRRGASAGKKEHKLPLSASARRFLKTVEENTSPAEAGNTMTSVDMLPVSTWQMLLVQHRNCYRKDLVSLNYSAHAQGIEPLRQAICGYLKRARGLTCQADQVVVTSGNRLDLICRLLIDPGDHVAVENPCFPTVRPTLLSYGANLHPIPVDVDGMQVEELTHLRNPIKLIYTTPSHQDPTGAVMSLDRRHALLDWVGQSGTLIWESDVDHPYRYGSQPFPALQGLDDHGLVIYSGSFWPALGPLSKLGFMVVPPSLVSILRSLLDLLSRDASLLEQYALTDLINDGHLERCIRRARNSYAKKRQALIHALKICFGETVHVFAADSGMHVLVRFKGKVDESAVMSAAARAHLQLRSSRPYYMQDATSGEYLIPFAALDEKAIQPAVEKFARALSK